MNSASARPERAHSNRGAPILSPLPHQLPYPYQTRIVNFSSYSGTKSAAQLKHNDAVERSRSFSMPYLENSQSGQRLKSAPANTRQIGRYDAYENNNNVLDLSTDGYEVFVDDQQPRPQTQSGRVRDRSQSSDIVGSENLMWLLDVAEKNSRKESARTASPQRTTSPTVPDPSESRNHNQERVEGPTFRSAPNRRSGDMAAVEFSKTVTATSHNKPKSAAAGHKETGGRMELVTSKSMPAFPRGGAGGGSIDSEPLLVAPRTVVDEILDDWQQQPYHQQYSIKTNPKTQKLKGVTQDFDEESSTSPYLEHLVTTNPRLANAQMALVKLHNKAPPADAGNGGAGAGADRRASTPGTAIIATSAGPKGFNITLNENTAIDPDFDKLSRPVPESKYPAHSQQLQPHLSGISLLPSASTKGLRPTTAQEKVAMFRASMAENRPTSSVNARAIHSQQGNWSAKGLNRMQRQAGNTNIMNTVPSDSLTHDLMGRGGGGGGNTNSIDKLISSIQFPTQQPLHDSVSLHHHHHHHHHHHNASATTAEVPFVDALDISLTTADQLAVLHNIHKDPLYRLLREECEALKADALAAAQAKEVRNKSLQSVSVLPGPTVELLQSSLDRPLRLQHNISNSELKVLKSFKALPPAVWITARIVYFLILSYYECFLLAAKNADGTPSNYRAKLNMEKFWSIIDHQYSHDHMQLANVMHLYSWPYLHSLLSQSSMFIKVLQVIEHGAKPADRNLFFESFPVDKLDFLRQLVQQGQGLFQETAVITAVPVCAKLCSWAKRVIANIYSSCLARIRLKQNLEANVPDEYLNEDFAGTTSLEGGLTLSLDATGTPFDPSLSLTTGNATGATGAAPETASSVDLIHDTSVIGGDPHTERPMNRLKVPHSKLASSMHIVASVQTSLPSSNADSFTQPLDMSTFLCSVSLTKPMDTLHVLLSDDRTSNSQFLELDEYRNYYEDCLRKYYTSPFHKVDLLSTAMTSTVLTSPSHHNFNHYAPLDSPPATNKVLVSYREATQAQSGGGAASVASGTSGPLSPSHGSNSSHRLAHTLQTEAGHNALQLNPILLFSTSQMAEVLITNQWNNPQFSSLISRAPSQRTTSKSAPEQMEEEVAISKATRSFLLSGRLQFKFSLVLASSDCGLISEDHTEAASLANNYVVCVKNTKNSWAAFQLACRLSKPADIVTVIHIPEIQSQDDIENKSSSSSITADRYEQQRAKAEKKIQQLAGIYKAAGFNLYVDDIPDFVDEAQRVMSNYFQKTALESRLQQADKTLIAGGNASVVGDLKEPRDQFVRNQYKYTLAQRILTVAAMFKPTYLILGADSVDLSLALSSAHKKVLSPAFPCKNDIEFSPEPVQITANSSVAVAPQQQQHQPQAPSAVSYDDNDSTGFIYNDNTSYTFESVAGELESQLDSPSRMNQTIEAEAALYEGDDDYYENDSFVIDDNNTYGADSFEGEDSNVVGGGGLDSRGAVVLSQKSSSSLLDAKNGRNKLSGPSNGSSIGGGKSPVETAASAAANKAASQINRELDLLQSYVSFSQQKVEMVEMLLHVNNELKEEYSHSVILANHVKARTR